MRLSVLRYICDNCGLCCTRTLVKATTVDAQREPRILGCRRLTDEAGHPLDQYLMNHDPGEREGCQFHDGSGCTIYTTRPNLCVSFAAGGEQCQALRQDAGLPPLVPVQEERDERRACLRAGDDGTLVLIDGG